MEFRPKICVARVTGEGLGGRDELVGEAVVVKSVFQTAAFAGFPNVSFMVNSLPKTPGK